MHFYSRHNDREDEFPIKNKLFCVSDERELLNELENIISISILMLSNRQSKCFSHTAVEFSALLRVNEGCHFEFLFSFSFLFQRMLARRHQLLHVRFLLSLRFYARGNMKKKTK